MWLSVTVHVDANQQIRTQNSCHWIDSSHQGLRVDGAKTSKIEGKIQINILDLMQEFVKVARVFHDCKRCNITLEIYWMDPRLKKSLVNYTNQLCLSKQIASILPKYKTKSYQHQIYMILRWLEYGFCKVNIVQKLLRLTWTTSSRILTSNTPGTKPAPIPWILCGPGH